ncbi:MAG: TolC family protein [Planctomycetota bacterium]|jgi:hypothetical protein
MNMPHPWILLPAGVLALMCGACRSGPLTPPASDLAAHTAEAHTASASAAGRDDPALADFEAGLLRIRDEWETKLRAPERLLTFYDFSTDEMASWREAASAPDFPATLAEDVTLERLLAGAFVRNPRRRAAHLILAGTIEQYAQVTYLDHIMRQYASFIRDTRTRVGPAIPMDQVGRRYPSPGTFELKAALVRHAVERARALYEVALRDVVTDVRVAYAQYIYLGRAIENTDVTLIYLRQLESTVRSKLSTGEAEKSHVIQTQVQISQLENDLITLHRKRDTVRANLNALLNLAPETPLGPAAPPSPGPFPADLDPLYAAAQEHQPEILAADARASMMTTMIELAEQSAYPDLTIGLSFMEDVSRGTGGSRPARDPFRTRPRVRPDPWFGTKEAYLREAREAVRAARERVRAVRSATALGVKGAWNELETAQRLYDLYAEAQVAQAEQAYRDAASGYAANRVEFLNVVDALRQWLRFLLSADAALRDYHQAHALLESAIGAPLPLPE